MPADDRRKVNVFFIIIVGQRGSVKKVLSEISQNSQSLLFNKVAGLRLIYELQSKFKNSRQVMKYWIDCLFSVLRKKKKFLIYTFQNKLWFDLKSINGI